MDKSDGELEALGQPASLFSSSSGSESEQEGEKRNASNIDKCHGESEDIEQVHERAHVISSYRQRASQLPKVNSPGTARDGSPEFRWDGSRIEKQQQKEQHEQNNKVLNSSRLETINLIMSIKYNRGGLFAQSVLTLNV